MQERAQGKGGHAGCRRMWNGRCLPLVPVSCGSWLVLSPGKLTDCVNGETLLPGRKNQASFQDLHPVGICPLALDAAMTRVHCGEGCGLHNVLGVITFFSG